MLYLDCDVVGFYYVNITFNLIVDGIRVIGGLKAKVL